MASGVASPDAKRTLLVWEEPRQAQALVEILSMAGGEVDVCRRESDGAYAVPDRSYRLVVLGYGAHKDAAHRFLSRLWMLPEPPCTLVITASHDKQDLLDLLAAQVLTNLITNARDVRDTDLVVATQKILRNDIFGIDKYLTATTPPIEEVIRGSQDKDRIVESLDPYLQRIGCSRRLGELAKSVADELVMNAVYNAPADQSGKPKYTTRPRNEPVTLERGEEARFSCASDGQTLAVAVADPFGRLQRITMLSYLRKCLLPKGAHVDNKQGGAGMGLYYIYESLNNLIINVAPGRRTEIIGLIDISGSYRAFSERPKALHVFHEEPST
ncbi:MAG: hypothetical protein HYZ27_04385 [Deltaproteobacteria bacterium]|nr:hypothetical protein [Deltaproteobacteria bacterium]